MRKLVLPALAIGLVTLSWLPESAACLWHRRARCAAPCPVSYTQPPVVCQYQYAYPAPTVWAPQAAPQAPAHAAAPAPPLTFRSPKTGKVYQLVPTNDRGESEEEEMREHAPSAAAPAAPRVSDGEHFAGSARKAAKTSFVSGAPKDFDSPGDLLDWVLDGKDPLANDHDVRPTLNPNSPRSDGEKRVVRVKAFLYATKKENDNDFHLLIGDDPNGGTVRYMTAEVSGLPNPDNASTPGFQTVRDQFKSFFSADPINHFQPPGARYVKFPTPIPVTITGPLFFDVDHKPGEVRTGNIAPATVWEIHPVSAIEFEP